MKTVSLGFKASEKYGSLMSVEDETEYPEVYLTAAQIKELGIEATPIGSMMTMTATVSLCEKKEDAEKGMSMEFEIRDAAFAMKEKPKDAATILFPNG